MRFKARKIGFTGEKRVRPGEVFEMDCAPEYLAPWADCLDKTEDAAPAPVRRGRKPKDESPPAESGE